MSTVSVALCTHNGARFLEAQVRSICAQTLPPAELVLSDDASTDGSVELVSRLLSEHPQDGGHAAIDLRVLRNARPLGARANFEQAMHHCRGEWIALCDQDDVWQPDRLRRLLAENSANVVDELQGDLSYSEDRLARRLRGVAAW